MYALVSAVLLILIVAALADIITRPDGRVKHLPKVVWVLLVIFLPVVGSLLWFAIGRDDPTPAPRTSARAIRRPAGPAPAPVPPGRRGRSTEEELADLEREIEFHAEQARIRLIEAELAERRRRAKDR